MGAESGGPYSSHLPPLVQQPSHGNTSFHSPMKGHVDETNHLDFGPNAPFWDTSIGQAIASFGTRLNSSEDEEEHRKYRATILRAQEIDKQIDDLLGPTPSRSTYVPVGYHSLADSMRPIEPIIDRAITPHNPGQNTTTSHVMSVPNPPRSSAPGTLPSILVSSVPSSAGGQPPTRPMLSDTKIVPSQGQTSNIEPSIVYVPPTHTNVVNLSSSSGQPLGAQPTTV